MSAFPATPPASDAAAPAAIPPRRQFLRSLCGRALATGLPGWLAACGGGGGDDDPGSPASSGDDAARLATLRGVEDHCRALTQAGLSPQALVQAVAEHLRSLPAYADAGVDEATNCAWGVMTDGRLHLVANNLVPARRAAGGAVAPRAQALAAATVETPSAATARVLQSFGPDFDAADVVTDLRTALREAGYTLRSGDPQHAGIEALREVAGDGYFYINTHGGAFQPTLTPSSSQTQYSIQSSTLVSDAWEAEPRMRTDLDAHRITYFTAHNGDRFLGLFDDWDTRYGITADFVQAYWRFAADSVVIINACSSARVAQARWAAGFVFACHQAGAQVYMGWDDTVTPAGAYRAGRYVTDRLLGANRYQPETPPQRAFPWDSVLADMHRKQLDLDPAGAARFLALPHPSGGLVPQLAPSIHHLVADEMRDELTLHGQFGAAEGEVKIDGQAAQVLSWASDRIVCQLPASGPGSAGPVQVQVRGVKSNLRRLTEWVLPLDYAWITMESLGLVVRGQGRIRWRADVAATREAAGDAPVQTARHTIATRESHLPLTASGSYPAGPCHVVWSGQQDYLAIPPAAVRDQLIAYLQLDPATRQGALGLALATPDSDFQESGCVSQRFQVGMGTLDIAAVFPSPLADSQVQIPLYALRLAFDPQFRLLAGRSETVQARLTWPRVEARFPPLPDDAL